MGLLGTVYLFIIMTILLFTSSVGNQVIPQCTPSNGDKMLKSISFCERIRILYSAFSVLYSVLGKDCKMPMYNEEKEIVSYLLQKEPLSEGKPLEFMFMCCDYGSLCDQDDLDKANHAQ